MTVLPETWRPVVGWEELYEVSDLGRVRRTAGGRGGTPNRIIGTTDGRYSAITIGPSGKRTTIRVHTLVLTAFVGPRPAGMECRHLNDNKRDNRLSNLAWGTCAENKQDMVRHGTRVRGQAHGAAKLTDIDVQRIHALRAEGKTYTAIAAVIGVVDPKTIGQIVRGETWRHLHPVLAHAHLDGHVLAR